MRYRNTLFLSAFSLMLIVFLLSGCSGISAFAPDGAIQTESPPTVSGMGLVISEVESSQQYTYVDDAGATPDWIELYNSSSSAINLAEYGLSDNLKKPYKLTFGNITIGAGEYLLVLATGETVDNQTTAPIIAPFALSKNGTTVVLTDPEGDIVQQVEVPALDSDVSWGIAADGSYLYHAVPTPGAVNSGPTSDTGTFDTITTASDLLINEIMPNNRFSIMDEDGDHNDWVELKNFGAEPISLSSYGISDDPNDRMKWVLPDMTLQPGDTILVYLSGKDRRDPNGKLHASFSLSSNDNTLILCYSGQLADQVNWEAGSIPNTVSYGRNTLNNQEWLYYPTPTPGSENSTKGFTVIDEALKLPSRGVWINEVSAVSSVGGDDPDWIELYNSGDPVNLKGYGLTNDKNAPFQWTFPDVTIDTGEYLTVYAGSGSHNLTTNFTLSGSGGEILLYNPQGVADDVFETGTLSLGITSGRKAGSDTDTRVFFADSTPGNANSSGSYQGYSSIPQFSHAGGYTNSGETVTLSAEDNGTIRYTTDGSEPNENSPAYSGAITISDSMTIRAKNFNNGFLPSSTATETFLTDAKHDIPVVCISSAPAGLFSDSSGIFADGAGWTEALPHTGANYWKDWERKIHFEYYEADGTLGVGFDAGMQVFGQYSRANAQKSVSIHLRGAYGQSEVTYPFFRDYDVTTFSSFLLRDSGQDWSSTKLRDAFFAQSVKGIMDLDYMEYRPVAVYINGEYWGLYNMREKVNEDYISNHYGYDADQYDMIKGNTNAVTGNNDAFQELRTYMKNHNLSNQDAYDHVASLVDVDEFMDYAILETYFNNTDTGNIKFWKPYDGGKWRWILFDMDWGLSPSTYQWNMIEEFFNPAGHGVSNAFYSHMQMGLLQNDDWRERLIERYAYHINNTFAPERLNGILDTMVNEIDSEMERQCDRWGAPSSYAKWQDNVSQLRTAINEKPEITIADLQEYFHLSDARIKELFPNY